MRNIKFEIALRKASRDDRKELRSWRNHAEVRKNFFNSSPVPLEEHSRWFESKIEDAASRIYIACIGKDKVGTIRFDIKMDLIYVSVNLNPDFFNRGIGHEIIELGTEKMFEEIRDGKMEAKPIIAEIKKGNIVSQKAFSKAGYKYERDAGDRLIYVKGATHAQSY